MKNAKTKPEKKANTVNDAKQVHRRMKKSELEAAIKASFPNKNWKLVSLSLKPSEKWAGDFRATCPVEERMSNKFETYQRKIRKICKAANAVCDGGGAAVGGSVYDNFFYIKK